MAEQIEPELLARARAIHEKILADADRRAAIMTIRMMRCTNYGSFSEPQYEPTEQEIQAFIKAIRENPRLVPSADPDDP